MKFMNEYEIEDAQRRWRDHAILGPATQTLSNLMHVTNRNSDGWAYWPKPARAAAKLMELIEAGTRYDDKRADVTPEKLKKAYAPIKAFSTRQGLPVEIVQPR